MFVAPPSVVCSEATSVLGVGTEGYLWWGRGIHRGKRGKRGKMHPIEMGGIIHKGSHVVKIVLGGKG